MAGMPVPTGTSTILLVDDDPTQRFLSREALERKGYRVEEADRGDVGYERALSLRPDLMLIDVVMPGMDGFALCQAIRKTPETERTPIILVTSLEDTASIERGMHLGANDFMAKPIVWPLFAYRVQFALRAAEMERELRVAKEESELASRAKSILLSNMSHELRTPLNAIIGFSEFLRSQISDPRMQGYLEDIHSSGKRLLSTINDVLDMANIESGRLAINEDRIDPARMVETVAKRFADVAAEKNLRIDLSRCAGAPQAMADPDMLKRVVGNLLANAIRFSDDGTIEVAAATDDDGMLRISVRDSGCGMTEAELASILEPFRQIDERLSRHHQGAGLGVPIARAMMELHGGRLEYRSEPGRGTTASAVLPLSRPHGSATGTASWAGR